MRSPRVCDLPDPPAGRVGWPWTSESTPVPERRIDGGPWPRISVVTPSYNQGEYIESTIRSVLLQGYADLEYIVVDGGSTDDSVKIIKKYDPWLKYWVTESDGGMYDAINKGFQHSTGEIMTWLNSDDMYVPDGLWAVGDVLAQYGRDVEWLTTTPSFCDATGRVCNPFDTRCVDTGLIRRGLYDGRVLACIGQESTFWRRSLWDCCGGAVDATLSAAGDFELWVKMSRYAELFSLRHSVATFRRHAMQKTATSMATYNAEVDSVLDRAGCNIRLHAVLRTRPGQRIAHALVRLRRRGRILRRDLQSKRWQG